MKHPVRPGAMAREENIFNAAMQLTGAAERSACLDQACAGDTELRARMEKLLAAARDPFFNTPPAPAHLAPSELSLVSADRTARGPELLADAPSGRIGRYKLLEKIGEGGCGVVYMAEQEEPVRRRVAVKVIKLGMDTRSVIGRFEAERQALAMMDHPNIARVLDAGATEAGRPFFVMELVRGTRITDYCDQNNLTTRARLALFMQVCHAIQHAHQKGIIHRDIKPSNILVTLHDGVPVPKVIDFGIAKATTDQRLTDKTLFTALEQFIGTPAYMSPEQAEMSGLDIDTRSDIYSLGVLLYELLTGQTPFDSQELLASGVEEMRRTIREKEPVRPSTRLSTMLEGELTATARHRQSDAPRLITLLRGDLDWIVMKCLEKDRARRYETANGLARDIQRHLNNETVLARPPSAAYRVQKLVRRNKLTFAAASAVGAALVIGLGVATVMFFRERLAREGEQQQKLTAQSAQKDAESQARNAFESKQHSRRLLYAAEMNLAQQSLNLDNLGRARLLLERHRPQPGEKDLRGWEWRYLWQLTRSSALVTLTNRPLTRGWSVSFSPDGTRLAVGWYDGRVDLWDIPGRQLVRVLTERAAIRHRGLVAFSQVQNLLMATSEPKAVSVYDFDSGRESILWRGPDKGDWRVHDLAFSEDGSKAVIYATDSQMEDAVWVVNVSSSRIENYQPTDYGFSEFHGGARLSPDNRRLYFIRSHSIECLDLTTGEKIWQTEPDGDTGDPNSGLTALAISPDGKILASASGFEGRSISVWDAASGRLSTRLQEHTGFVCDLAFTRDRRRLISSASDQTIRLWDTANWALTGVLRGHTEEVRAIALSETAKLLASAGKDGNLILWKDDPTNSPDGYRRFPKNLPPHGLVTMDGSRVLLLPTGQPPELLDLKRGLSPISFPELGLSRNVLGGFGTNVLCHWNGTNQVIIRELRDDQFIQRGAVSLDFNTRPTGFAYNAARQTVAWTKEVLPASIYVASLAAPDRRVELRSDVPGLVILRFSENGEFLLASKWRGMLRAWNIETGQIVASIGEGVVDANFAAGGQVLVASLNLNRGHEVLFYDLVKPDRAVRRIPGRDFAGGLAVSPDSGLVASSFGGSRGRLFDPLKAESIDGILLYAAIGLAFSPDGQRLISTKFGRDAGKLWSVDTWQELLTLAGNGSYLHQARWSADGNVILAGPPWQAWRAPSWEEIAAAEAKEQAAP